MIRSRQLVAIAGAAALLVALAACSAEPATQSATSQTPTTPATTATQAAVNDRTYTKPDLETILSSVNTTLKLDGGIAITDGPNTDPVNAIGPAIGDSPTISPSSCETFTDFNAELVDLLGTSGVIVGTIGGPHLNLIVATVSGATLPASLKSSFATKQSARLAACKHLTVTTTVDGEAVTATIDHTPLRVTTDATQSIGFDEKAVITGGGGHGTTSSTWLAAIDGNLLLFATSVTEPDKTGLEKAVNAAVAATKG